MPLSVAIVCRNNEPTIGRTLESVAGLADEIVAVDSGSTDGTIGLLERHGARVIASPWLGHVATKQKALEACTREWVLCLDSDESLEADLRQAVEVAIRGGDGGPSGYEVNRVVYYRGRALRHAWQPEHRLRLVRRGRARWTGLDPHDKLELIGRSAQEERDSAGTVEGAKTAPEGRGTQERGTGRLRGTLRHDSISTFAEFLVKQSQHARTMAMSLHREGQRGSLVRLCVSPAGAFLKQIVLKRAFLDGWPGWLAAASSASGALMKHAMLMELTRTGYDWVESPVGDQARS